MPALAQELAAKKPAVIVATTIPAVTAAANAAPTTPIVVAGGDPLAAGLVSNLARSDGMITGLTSVQTEVNAKHFELLLNAVPKLRRIGFLGDASLPPVIRAALTDTARRSIARHPIEGYIEEAVTSEEIDAAVLRLAKHDVQALIAMAGPLLFTQRRRIATLALAGRWPLVAGAREWTDDGALLAYGNNCIAMARRAAYYVGRILKGAKPGDLPIEQPMTFEMVVDLKTAKALGLTMPPQIMVQATHVIQ